MIKVSYCRECGCYVPIDKTVCVACGYDNRQVKEVKKSILKPSVITNYTPLCNILFGDKPIGFYPDYVSPSWDEKTYNRLQSAIFLFIQSDKDFRFWNHGKIKEIPAFSNVGLIAIDEMLFSLTEQNKIEMYAHGLGAEDNYYRRLPQNRAEERNRRKYYSYRYKRLVFHY